VRGFSSELELDGKLQATRIEELPRLAESGAVDPALVVVAGLLVEHVEDICP
jgi:hypothetical protein